MYRQLIRFLGLCRDFLSINIDRPVSSFKSFVIKRTVIVWLKKKKCGSTRGNAREVETQNNISKKMKLLDTFMRK